MTSKCVACGESVMIVLGRHPDGTILRCDLCGSLRLLLTNGTSVKNGDGYGQSYRSGLDQAKSKGLISLFRSTIDKEEVSPGKLVDIGCGDGSFMRLLARDGWSVTGIDSDTSAVDELASEGQEALVGELGTTSMPQLKNLDVITLWDLIEHLDDPDGAMRWLSDSVKQGGHVLLLTPNASSMLDWMARVERSLSFTRSQKLMQLCLNRYHLNRFTPAGIRKLFVRYGFLIKSVQLVQLYSLSPERYLSGFAPGIDGWTRSSRFDRILSRTAFAVLSHSGIKNKIYLVAQRTGLKSTEPIPSMRAGQ